MYSSCSSDDDKTVGNDSTDDEYGDNMLVMHNVVQQGSKLKAQFKYTHDMQMQLIVLKSPEYMINGIIPIQLKLVSSYDRDQPLKDDFILKLYVEIKTEKFENMKVLLSFSSDHLGITDKHFNLTKRKKILLYEESQYRNDTFSFNIALNVKLVEECGKFESMYDDTDLTDIEINGTDGSVKMHKFVIAAASDVFKRMLSTQMKEAATGKIDLIDMSKVTLEQLKMYLYKGKVPKSGLKELLLLGHRYLILGLEYKCIEKMVSSLTAENFLDLEEFAIRNQMTNLRLSLLERVQNGGILVKDIKECLKIKSAQKRSTSPDQEGAIKTRRAPKTERKMEWVDGY